MPITSQLFTHTPTHSHTLTCAPIELISWTSEGTGGHFHNKDRKELEKPAFDEFIVLCWATFLSVCGRRKIWVPCGVEGVRGSRTGLSIYAPLGPPRRAHREPLWWLGAWMGGFQVFQEDRTLSSAALLFLSSKLCFNILQRMTAMCLKETWNVSQNPTSSFVGFCVLFFLIYFQPLWWLRSNSDGCDFNNLSYGLWLCFFCLLFHPSVTLASLRWD